MDFLNKHYEKLILLGMLVFFIIAMVNVLSISSQTGEVKDSDLRIPTRQPDYKPENASDKRFTVEAILDTGKFSWREARRREAKSQFAFYSDLMSFPELAVCFKGKDDNGKETGCGDLIPKLYFSEKPCPSCGRILKTPPKRAKIRRNVITADDSDGDGMPNSYEQSNNLDSNNPYDALYDPDNDGFTNIFEMEKNTNPQQGRHHPPLWFRLRLVAVRSVVLPISFKALNTNKQEDQKRWDVQLNLRVINPRNGRVSERTMVSQLNGTVEIEKRRYRIKRIERIISDSTGGKKKEALVAGGVLDSDKDKAQDLSKIYLEEELSSTAKKAGAVPDKLEMQIGKPVYSSDKRPIFEDLGKPEGKRKEIVVRPGESFRMGSYATGVSSYKLIEFKEKEMVAVLNRVGVRGKQDPAKDEMGNAMIVTRDGQIPEDSRVIEPITSAKNDSVDVREKNTGRSSVRRRR